MAAPPPPPPPPPPPGPSNTCKPDNKKLLDSICKGTSLKKVPDSVKNDRSAAIINKPQGFSGPKTNSGILIPPSGKPMSIAEELAARKNSSKVNVSPSVPQLPPNFSNPKKGGVPLPNAVPPQNAPPPPSANKKPVLSEGKPPVIAPPNFMQPPPPVIKPLSEMKPSPSNFPPPPSHQVVNYAAPPPPPPPPLPKDSKSNLRPPVSICSKPTVNDDRLQIRGPIIPPLRPPAVPQLSNEVHPPRFALPPPPPPPPPFTISGPPLSSSKPSLPIRTDSNIEFDSRFTFIDVKSFPDPKSITKIRQT